MCFSFLSFFSQRISTKADVRYPAAVAVTYDPINHWLSCVYNDHSLYVWDVRDVSEVEKVHSALFHGGCVWDLEVNMKEEVKDTAAGTRVSQCCLFIWLLLQSSN